MTKPMERYIPGIGYAAGALMIKWDELNLRLHTGSSNDIKPGENVNVFISLESILLNMRMMKDLRLKAQRFKQQVVIELESSMLNLMASYKGYFRKDNCNVKLYFYSTSLNESPQQMSACYKYYRSTYYNRYLQNPRYRDIGELMKDLIIPEVKLILQYVENCYLIESTTFDGSIIPMIISKQSTDRNVIITSDPFDTLYWFDPNFITFYVRRKYRDCDVFTSPAEMVNAFKERYNIDDEYRSIFNAEMYYRLILLQHGDDTRNILSGKESGINFIGNVIYAYTHGRIISDPRSIAAVLKAFTKLQQEEIKQSLQCLDLETHYNLLTDTDIDFIKTQLVDRVDPKSVEALNNVRFLEFPINLQFLI